MVTCTRDSGAKSEAEPLGQLEAKSARLGRQFRLFMNIFGLCADVTLLLDHERCAHKVARRQHLSGLGPGVSSLARVGSLALVLLANSVAVYTVLSHFIWEFRMLEEKSWTSANSTAPTGTTATPNWTARTQTLQPQQLQQQPANGWSVLKEFLENLRRHLSRLFSLTLTLTWHLSCHKIELLFVECRRYYALLCDSGHFRPAKSAGGQWAPEEARDSLRAGRQRRLLAASSNFYRFARRRIHLAICLPLVHFVFNLVTVTVFPSQPRRSAPEPSAGLLQRAQDNFDSFHLNIHTAFHPFDHHIGGDQVAGLRSALYCVCELLVYSLYFHGPRIICATCLSLVLHLHYLCLLSFNRQLVAYGRRPRERPLTGAELELLVRRYDLIGLMHERIERTFKWSLVQWFGLMFISCLMHIFAFTESTYAVSGGAEDQRLQQQVSGSSLAILFVRLASVAFVCYSPYLIYCEAFRIEAASNRAEQNVVRLVQRSQDPVAQAIEPGLFEPIYLSVGDYFHISKKSMSAFLGAIVTFSVMFIASPSAEEDPREANEQDNEIDPDEEEPAAADDSELELADEDRPEEDQSEEDEQVGGQGRGQEDGQAGDDQVNGAQPRADVDAARGAYWTRPAPPTGSAREQPLRKAAQRRKYKRLNRLRQRQRAQTANSTAPPALQRHYAGRLRENERQLELRPKLRALNQVELCDMELLPAAGSQDQALFVVSWIDRVSGEASLEARDVEAMNCERQRNFTFKLRAVGCNGLHSEAALVEVQLEDVNEFSPEFERPLYVVQLDPEAPPRPLATVRARDRDCSPEQGVCRYELLPAGQELLRVDPAGRLWLEGGAAAARWRAAPEPLSLQLIAHDCAGRKSAPAALELRPAPRCAPALKDVETRIAYKAASGDRSPFRRAQLDLCGAKCHRPNISLALSLEADEERARLGRHFHCDREPYSMVSRRRLCGARSRVIELSPAYSVHSKWIWPLHQASRLTSSGARRRQAKDPLRPVPELEQGDEALASDEAPDELRGAGDEHGGEELGAYSPEGSYGRQAIEALAAAVAANRSDESEQEPVSAGARARSHRFHHGRSTRPRRVRSPSAHRKPRPLDPSSVYRDQVYRLDGLTSAARVPSSVYLPLKGGAETPDANTADGQWPPFLFGPRHTVTLWMRHAPHRFPNESAQTEKPDEQSSRQHVKEHLLCATTGPSRTSGAASSHPHLHRHHYYSLFVRNCKLVLLMRRRGDSRTYLPAEWRWSLEACDNKWHLYTINVNYPAVELFVDGQPFAESRDNLVVVDDLPLPSGEPEEPPTLSLGACWDARQQLMTGHFRGALSGLSVLAGANEDSRAAECLGRCTEALVSTAGQPLRDPAAPATGAAPSKPDNSLVSYQESQLRILLQGHDFLDVEEALTQIVYTNRRLLPSVGRRSIRVDTSVECAASPAAAAAAALNSSHSPQATPTLFTIPMEPVRVEVEVLPARSLPVIQIGGLKPNVAREAGPLSQGVRLFAFVSLRVRRLNLLRAMYSPDSTARDPQSSAGSSPGRRLDADYIEDSPDDDPPLLPRTDPPQPLDLSSTRRHIESCSVRVQAPPLNPTHESLILPEEELDRLQLYWRQSPEGALIYGLDTVENYQRLVGSILYKNQRAAFYSERLFRLVCSDMNGRVVSNEFTQTVTMIHQKPGGRRAELEELADGEPQVLSALPPEDARFAQLQRLDPPRVTHLAPSLLNIEQSSKLDRLGMAFFVFVISLLLIMLVIALTNLKEPSLSETGNLSSAKRRASLDPETLQHTLSYDIDSTRASLADCYYADEMQAEAEEDEDEEEEDEEEEEEDDDEAQYRSRAADYLSGDSLSWDDEPLTSSIVMNPILHGAPGGPRYSRRRASPERQVRTLVSEQRPDSDGSMRRPAHSHVSYHSPLLAGGQVSAHQFRLLSQPLVPLDEIVSSGSESADSSSSCGEEEVGDESRVEHHLCGRHPEEEDEDELDSEASSSDYELQHQHHLHHFHHTCLRRQLPAPDEPLRRRAHRPASSSAADGATTCWNDASSS